MKPLSVLGVLRIRSPNETGELPERILPPRNPPTSLGGLRKRPVLSSGGAIRLADNGMVAVFNRLRHRKPNQDDGVLQGHVRCQHQAGDKQGLFEWQGVRREVVRGTLGTLHGFVHRLCHRNQGGALCDKGTTLNRESLNQR